MREGGVAAPQSHVPKVSLISEKIQTLLLQLNLKNV